MLTLLIIWSVLGIFVAAAFIYKQPMIFSPKPSNPKQIIFVLKVDELEEKGLILNEEKVKKKPMNPQKVRWLATGAFAVFLILLILIL